MTKKMLISILILLLLSTSALNFFNQNQLKAIAAPTSYTNKSINAMDYNLTDRLEITVAISKPLYAVGEELAISGSLILIHENQSFPVPGQLVAVQINDRLGVYVVRTLETAPGTTQSQWQIEIRRAYIGDANGNPLTTVSRGQIVYTWLTYHNNWNTPLYVVTAYTILDSNNVPLYSIMPLSYTIPPGTNITLRDVWKVPNFAASGAAKLCASAFSQKPSLGGTPYCPEAVSIFTIGSSSYFSANYPPSYQSSSTGTYALNVLTSKKVDATIPIGTRNGTYTVYVAAKYGVDLKANASITFEVKLMGDVDQVRNPTTGVYTVNVLDAIKLAQSFGSVEGSSNWNPKADFNNDKKVNILDAIVLSSNFGNQAL